LLRGDANADWLNAPLAVSTAKANEIFCRYSIIETFNENEVSEQANVRVSGRYAETKKLNFDGTMTFIGSGAGCYRKREASRRLRREMPWADAR